MQAASFCHLPTVEDSSLGSGSDAHSRSSRNNSDYNINNNNNSQQQQSRMKRSPYLSVMAGSTKESEDLVAMLSRPAPGGQMGSQGGDLNAAGGGGGLTRNPPGTPNGGAMGGLVGKSTFFDLKRPSSGPGSGMGGGASFMLESPAANTVTPVSSAGEEFTDAQQEADGDGNSSGGGGGNNATLDHPGRMRSHSSAAAFHHQRPLQPSLRSALRMSSRSDVKGLRDSATGAQAEMKKNTSVTFSTTTKKASILGAQMEGGDQQGNARFLFGPQAQLGGQQPQRHFPPQQQMQQQPSLPRANYTAAMMMKKSQSIASPQFMLAHKNSVSSGSHSSSATEKTANESFGNAGNAGGAEGNASFPIYFSKLPGEEGKEQGGGGGGGPAGANPAGMPQQASPNAVMEAMRQRSKSMNTLKYYYQNPVQQAANLTQDPGQALLNNMAHARPSNNGLNLTFREMLDEGDGKDGDLNSNVRNQAWKDFRSFSSRFEEDNPMMTAAMERVAEDGEDPAASPPTKDNDDQSGSTSTTATGNNSIPLSGSKRTLTPSSLGSNPSVGGLSKFGLGQGGAGVPNAVGMGGMAMPQRTLAGSHRGAVSVNDLAVLRRAAARMKMNNPMDAGAGNNSQTGGPGARRESGAILGGEMLSRLSSAVSEISESDITTRMGNNNASGQALSPLAQMMAKKNSASQRTLSKMSSGSSSTGLGGGGDKFNSESQRDLFMQKFQMAMQGSKMGDGGGNMG
eukprot:CAMPEP_0183719512 /NCGR_PEP_ID=MMETSP0737-20130205/12414_1 /TAXON_ID=385413 /ORGANISM="Thalassiosira miniscula, Strain CCMP1093" /LENGTH=737 /DNA_ID=CAMNT_0025949231 /DNA_START=118 /DNA_END=2328 /DNA_ORIENTATION=-